MSLHHLPTRRIVSRPTLARSRAMDPPVWREQALMSVAVNPMARTTAPNIAQMVAVILTLMTCAHVLEY